MTQRTSDAWARLQPIAHSGAPDLAECERFLLHEARLLDEGRFDEWLGLFTAEAWYWVPAEPNQTSPRDTISLIYDDRRLLETRVRRLARPRIYSQEPRSRTSRMIGNVTLEERGDDAVTGPSKIQLRGDRRGSERIFGGPCLHRLVRGDDGIRIAWKRVDLVNCDAPHEGLVVPF